MAKTIYEIMLQVTGAQQAEQQLSKVERTVNILGQLEQSAQGLMNVGSQVNGFVAQAQQANAEMERGLTNLQVIMGSTREEAEEYKTALDEQLERVNYNISLNDALTASYDAASAGFTDAADAMGVMSAGMDLAIAGTSGLDDASTNLRASQNAIVVGLQNYSGELSQYGDTAAQAERISAKLNAVIALGITDIKQLAPAFAEIAPSAAGAGVNLDQLALSFAQITSTGIKAAQATTGMKAVLAAMGRGGPTEEAKKKLAEAGVQFDVAAIKAKGFMGVMKELQAANLTSFDDLLAITGSTEAANAMLTMLDQAGDKLAKMDVSLEKIKNAEALQGIVDQKTTDEMGRMVAASERLNAAMAELGAEVRPVTADLKLLAVAVIEAFNDLPDWLQRAIGQFVTLGAGIVTVGGGMVILAAQIGQAVLSLKQMAAMFVKTEMAAKLAGAAQAGYTAITALTTKALIAMNIPLTAAIAKLALIAAPITIAVAAIAGFVVAWKRMTKLMEDTKAIEEAEEQLKGLADTEELVQKIGAVGIKMHETGKALPQAEFDAYIKKMQEANDEHGSMDRHIEALTNLQNKLSGEVRDGTAATESANAASKDRTKVLEEQEEAAKALAEAEQKAVDAVRAAAEASREAKEAAMSEVSMGRQSGGLSISDAFALESAALAEYDKAVRTAYNEILNTQKLSTEKQKELQTELSRHNRQQEQARLDHTMKMAEQNRKNVAAQNQIALLALEDRANQEMWSDRKLTDEKAKLRNEQLKGLIAATQAELTTVAAGSERQRELTVQLYSQKAELSRSEKGIQDRVVKDREEQEKKKAEAAKKSAKEQKKAAEQAAKEQKRIAKEETEARKAAWAEETRLHGLELKNRLDQSKQAADAQQQILAQMSSFGGLQGDALGNVETALQAEFDSVDRYEDLQRGINDLMDRRGGILSDNAAKQAELNDKLKAAKGNAEEEAQIRKQLAALRDKEEEQIESINQQLAEKRAEQERQHEISMLVVAEQKRSVEFLNRIGVAIDLNGDREDAQLAIVKAKLALEERQLQIKLQQQTITANLQKLEQDRFIAEQERALLREDLGDREAELIRQQITQAETSKRLIDQQLNAQRELMGLQQEVRTQSERTNLAKQGIDPRGLGDAKVELDPKSADIITNNGDKMIQATREEVGNRLETLKSANEAGSKQVQAALEQNLAPIPKAMQAQSSSLDSGFGSAIAATQAQTTELAQQLRSLESAVNTLPGRIASSLPRPQPPIRGK